MLFIVRIRQLSIDRYAATSHSTVGIDQPPAPDAVRWHLYIYEQLSHWKFFIG